MFPQWCSKPQAQKQRGRAEGCKLSGFAVSADSLRVIFSASREGGLHRVPSPNYALVAQRKSEGLRSPGSQVQILPRVPVYIGRVAQSVEAIDLKSMSCGCNSRRGHHSFFPFLGVINRTSVPASPAKRSVPSFSDGMRCKSSWLRHFPHAHVAQCRGARLRPGRLQVQVLPWVPVSKKILRGRNQQGTPLVKEPMSVRTRPEEPFLE